MDDAIAPIGGAAAWRGAELAARGFWPRRLSEAEIAGLEAALASVKAAGRAPPAIAQQHFAIPALAPLLADLTEELEHGAGVVRVSGLPVDRLAKQDLRTVFWGLCANIGTPLFQNTTV